MYFNNKDKNVAALSSEFDPLVFWPKQTPFRTHCVNMLSLWHPEREQKSKKCGKKAIFANSLAA